MATDERDVLEVLKFELNFLEQGGYGRSVHTSQTPTSIFQDSITCLNFGEPRRPHPCAECMLIDFVPESSRNENVPCHHIPLTPSGETVATLESGYNQAKLEGAAIAWLRAVIARIEQERLTRSA
ncbi:MAG: hypothetical protein LAN64_01135 [Acidobacteriia bacterium]|nr:hypothetical protein [Terriglobia bacterium]